MAFITTASFKKLCKKVDVKEIDKDQFLKEVFDNLSVYNILNKIQREYLFKYAMLLKDEVEFKLEYYQYVPPHKDTYTLVLEEESIIKYHLYADCPLLLKDYTNFYIPEDIRKFGIGAVEEFRSWFKSKRYFERYKLEKKNGLQKGQLSTKELIRLDFNLKYPLLYGIAEIVEGSNLISIDLANSQMQEITSEFEIEDFKKEINTQLNLWEREFKCSVSRTCAKHAYLINKSDAAIEEKMAQLFSPFFTKTMGIVNLKEKLKLANDIAFRIMSLIINYLKWTYSFKTKNFDKLTLDDFGLRCCNACSERAQETYS
jgi:hypothetical protein